MRRCLGILVILAMGGALAACSSGPVPSTPPVADTPVIKPPPPRPEAARRPETAPPLPAAPSLPDVVTPPRLTGMDRGQTVALLGRPARETPRAMGTEWSYGHGSCRLSLVFYPEVESNVERVLGYEFAGGTDPAVCLKRLRKTGATHGK